MNLNNLKPSKGKCNVLCIVLTLLFLTTSSQAQQFVEKAVIEFEVNTNLKKKMGSDSWDEMLKDNISDLKTYYSTYSFEANKSIFKFNRWSPKTKIPSYYKEKDEEQVWYSDFNTKTLNAKKHFAGTTFIISDSIVNIEWKISNENQEIAGYNCRKAVGKIFGDVYIFAFYTDDITISGGPCSINGLPGMILGLTIPRLYTSYVATKVTLTGVDKQDLKPLTAKKTYTNAEFKMFLDEKFKDWYSSDSDKEETKRQKNMALWETML